MTKKEIANYLNENGIDFDVTSTKAELEALVEKDKASKNPKVEVKIVKETKKVDKNEEVSNHNPYIGIAVRAGKYVLDKDGSAYNTLEEAVANNG